MNCTVRELILLVSNKEFFLTRGIPHFHCIQRKFRTVHIIEKGEEKEEGWSSLIQARSRTVHSSHYRRTLQIFYGPSFYSNEFKTTGQIKKQLQAPGALALVTALLHQFSLPSSFFFLANVAVILFIFCSWWQDPGCCHLQVSNKDEAETASNLSQLNQFSWTRTRTRTHLLALLRLPEYHWVIEFIISLLG